ncbi:MAG: hypothetical protein HY770_04790 [Chitinivibrionia bacterium]|nr:hypothetical protein [Chitinivibrionia bacterium]
MGGRSGMGGQGMGGQGMNGQAGGQEPIVAGEVAGIDEYSLTVTTERGETKRLTRTAHTSFVREMAADRSALAMGSRVFVIGESSGQETVVPRMLRILEKIDEAARSRGPEGRMSGDRSQGQMGAGPVIGTVIGLDPLKIQQTSGATTTVRLTEGTQIFREESVSPSQVTKGVKVRVLAPPKPDSESREALKVILVSAAGQARQQAPVGRSLLPDLPGRADSSEFFYGIWLGRGPYSDAELDRAFRLVQNLGIRNLLVEFKWDYVEPAKGRWRWDNRDILNVEHVIELARQYRISISPYFDLFTPWGERKNLDRDKGECEGPPSGKGQFQAPVPEEYAAYVFSVVDKLKTGGVDVKFVALDNEDSNINDGYRSWNCFINATAKQIKTAENAAYDRIKAFYPEIMVSSTTFSFPGIAPRTQEQLERDRTRKNSFIKAYFGDEPRPKFDFLALHETLSGSGNPYTTLPKPAGASYEYAFSSYHEGYDIWRSVLDRYGYSTVPIINTEGDAVLAGLQDAELIQKAVFARANASRNDVRGWILAQLTASKFLGEGSEQGVSVGITRLESAYQLKEGYFGYHTLLSMMTRYPSYAGTALGTLNARTPWVEKFVDGSGNVLYVAFLPYQRGSESRVPITLPAAPDREVRVTKSNAESFIAQSTPAGLVSVEVGQSPVFIEAGMSRK